MIFWIYLRLVVHEVKYMTSLRPCTNCGMSVSSCQHEIHFRILLLCCPHSRQLAPSPIQKALLEACAFLCQEEQRDESLREHKKWRPCVSFQCLVTSPALGRQAWLTFPSGFVVFKQCRKVWAFYRHEIDVVSKETLGGKKLVAQQLLWTCKTNTLIACVLNHDLLGLKLTGLGS